MERLCDTGFDLALSFLSEDKNDENNQLRAEGILWDKLCYISINRSTSGHVLEFSVTLSQRIKCKHQQLSNRFDFKNLETL